MSGEPPDDAPGLRRFPLEDGAVLVAAPIAGLPSGIEIVNTFRPAEEQSDILKDAIAAGARAFWVQPGESVSDEARRLAAAAGLPFVEGRCIAATVRELGVRAAPFDG